MSSWTAREGVFIGECGHLVELGAPGELVIGPCVRCERGTSRRRAAQLVADLAAAVEELARLHSSLGQVVALAEDAPSLTDGALRDRLAALADRARDGSTSPTEPRPAAG